MDPAAALTAWLTRHDPEAFSTAVGTLTADNWLHVHPEALRAVSRAAVTDLATIAAAEGAHRLIQACELSLRVDGPPPDEALEGLRQAMRVVRWALGQLAPLRQPRAVWGPERKQEILHALGTLAELVRRYDDTLTNR